MLQDAVVAIVPGNRLREVLPAVHRAGMGYLARVATPSRGPLLDQLQRAGIPVSQAPPEVADSDQLMFLSAGGRSMMTAMLLLQHHVDQVWIVNGLGAWVAVDDTVVAAEVAPVPSPTMPQVVPGRHSQPTSMPGGETGSAPGAEGSPVY
jgi:rhodanese-related sulfurtransferase